MGMSVKSRDEYIFRVILSFVVVPECPLKYLIRIWQEDW